MARRKRADVDDAWATTAQVKKTSRKKTRRSSTTIHRDSKTEEEEGEEKESQDVGVALLPTPSPTPMRTTPLLICSIGNPGPTYANTLHSAGHTVLNRLATHLNYPPFHKNRSLGNGLVSSSDSRTWTLWQSTSYMNVSGKGVRDAWKTWSREVPDGRLVVVYDELEKALGSVTVRTAQGLSAKGHNGLKSLLGTMARTPFARIGVGIGRPESRESEDVARFVLRKMTAAEKVGVEGCVEEVVAKLEVLEKG